MIEKRHLQDSVLSSFKALGKNEKIDLLASLILSLKDKAKDSVPVAIFNNSKLSTFEALVKYLKENLGLRFVKIALLLKRSDKTVWVTYNKAGKKMAEPFPSLESDINIPISNFSDRAFTVFESLVAYLKQQKLTNHEIAILLHRDDRTIWSVYDRVKKKLVKNEN